MKDNNTTAIRLLTADEIECRIGTISEKGLSLLLYKDARADMKILDEIYGPMNWQRTHEVIGGNLYCNVQIYDEQKQQWISKMDVGTESYTEKEKGQASDSFKRACVSVGIGRELYTAPFIWISAEKCRIQQKDNRYITYDKFKIMDITYNDKREITGLIIVNQDGQVVYSLQSKIRDIAALEKKQSSQNGLFLTEEQMMQMKKELERTGVALDAVLMRYKINSVDEMTQSIFNNAMNSLKKTKKKAA